MSVDGTVKQSLSMQVKMLPNGKVVCSAVRRQGCLIYCLSPITFIVIILFLCVY